jgi:hypothetical protein
MGAAPSQGRKFLSFSGRNRRNIFDVLIEQPMLAGIDEGDVDALHDGSDPQRV